MKKIQPLTHLLAIANDPKCRALQTTTRTSEFGFGTWNLELGTRDLEPGT